MSQPYFSARQNYNIACHSPLMMKARIVTFPRLSGHRGNVKVLPRPTSPFNKGELRGIWTLLSHSPTRVLKNVFEAASTRQKLPKNRSLHPVNEHFEAIIKAGIATQIVFQPPATETYTAPRRQRFPIADVGLYPSRRIGSWSHIIPICNWLFALNLFSVMF